MSSWSINANLLWKFGLVGLMGLVMLMAACSGEEKQYDALPPMTINLDKTYTGAIEMEKEGKIRSER